MPKTGDSGLIYIFACIGLTVVGQLLVKFGVQSISRPGTNETTSLMLRALVCPWVILGLIAAVAAAAAWTVAISRCDLSFAYPFMGLAIVLVLLLTPLVFHEHVPLSRWIGVAVVCVGLWIASRSW